MEGEQQQFLPSQKAQISLLYGGKLNHEIYPAKVSCHTVCGVFKLGFHLCLKGAWDMSKVPVTHVSTCVLNQAQ